MKIKNPKARLASLDSLAAFFRHVEISGSHEASLTYVIEGRADIAAIDRITLAHLQNRPQEAYLIQEQFLRLCTQEEEVQRDPFGGYKLAYTTAIMQTRSGLTEPALGRISAKAIYSSPTTLRASDYIQVGLECEIAVQLDKALPASDAP